MKTKKIRLVIMFVSAFLIFSTGNFASAQCKHQQQQQQQQEQQQTVMPDNPAGPCCFGFLKGLTPEQEKQITALQQKMMKESLPLKNQIGEKKAHLKTITSGDNVDMGAVTKTIDELYALKAELAKKHEGFKQDVRKLLNDEQKIMFDMHQAKGKHDGKNKCGMGGNGHGMGSGCGNGCMGQGNPKGCGMGQGNPKGCGMEQGMGAGCGKGSGMGCCKK